MKKKTPFDHICDYLLRVLQYFVAKKNFISLFHYTTLFLYNTYCYSLSNSIH